MHKGHIPVYIRSVRRMRCPRRYVVTYALRWNLTFILPLHPSNSLFLSRSYTKLPFDVKQSTRRLLLCPLSLLSLFSLYCTHDYCICVIAVVDHFEFPRTCAEEKKEREKKKHTSIDSLVTIQTWYRYSYEKRTVAKKGLRACVSFGVQLIEVHLYARPAARRNENAVRDNGGYGGVRGVHFHPSSGSYSRRRTSDGTRGKRRVGGRSGGRTLIKPS